MTLPTGITAGAAGHIGHHNTIHDVINKLTAGVAPSDLVDYYVDPVNGNDANSGLTPFQPKLTIAAAVTTIGGTTDNTNVAHLHLQPGTYGSSGSPLAPVEIKGVIGFRVTGYGEKTMLWNQNAQPMFRGVNTMRCEFADFTCMGSPGATGWGIEFQANYSGGFVGGVAATRNEVRRVIFGRSPFGATPAMVNGIRFTLRSGSTVNDANNDQSIIEDCEFLGITGAPISIEHANSLWHKIVRPLMSSCGGGVKLQGGSCTVHEPIAANGTGYFVDLQNPVGAGNPIYYHKAVEVWGWRAEQGSQGWARSSVGAGVSYAGAFSQPHVSFIGGQVKYGGLDPGPPTDGKLVDWQAVTSLASGPARLEFIGGSFRVWFGSSSVSVPSATSEVIFQDCDLGIHAFTYAGRLSFDGCSSETAFTITPTGTATQPRQRNCRGLGFIQSADVLANYYETVFVEHDDPGVARVNVAGAALFALNDVWQDVDLSGVLPAGVSAVLLNVICADATNGPAAGIRTRQKKTVAGATGAFGDDSVSSTPATVAGFNGAQVKVAVSAGRVFSWLPAGFSIGGGSASIDLLGYYRR